MRSNKNEQKTITNPDFMFPEGKKTITTIEPREDVVDCAPSLRSDLDYLAMMLDIEL